MDIIDRFEAAVWKHGNRPAIEFGDRTWSYQEFDLLSDDLARNIQSRSVHSNDVVVIDCERSPVLVLAVLACVKAARTFFVVGENQPEIYVASALESVDNIFWLGVDGYSDEEKARRIAGRRLSTHYILNKNHLENSSCKGDEKDLQIRRAEDLSTAEDRGMYLVATSGTTGRPKLVFTSVSPILNFIDWYQGTFSLSSADKFSMLSGLGYDPLIRDIFTPLTMGACVSIPAKEALSDRRGLHDWINSKRVSVIHATPQLAQVIFDQDEKQQLDSVRVMAIGGSALSKGLAAHIKSLLTDGLLVNVYGTSETPQVMTYHIVEGRLENIAGEEVFENVSIGKPISQIDIKILNADGDSCNDSEVGEIHVVTPHLAIGYYHDPELTAKAFSFLEKHGCRSYSTGDLGFVDGDGNLNYVGRKDRQVKCRGYRIQLEEIEQAIQSLDKVVAAAVVHEGDKNQSAGKIACYVQARPGMEFQVSDIKQKLVGLLPTYMMPDNYIFIEKMPQNSRNKIDYAGLKLAVPIAAASRKPEGKASTRDNLVSKELLSIWADVLETSKSSIALDSNFFDIGGNSLLTVKLIEYMNIAFSKKLKITDLFIYSSINDLSKFITSKNDDDDHLDHSVNAGRRAQHLSQMHLERNGRIQAEI